jgi:hypothetical protein
MLCAVAASLVAFAPPGSVLNVAQPRVQAPVVSMDMSRREMFSVAAAAAAFAPLAAQADGASSPAVLAKTRAIYGSRVFRLQSASPAAVLEDKNVFTLFRTGSYRSAADKDTVKKLASLEKTIIKAAKAGDGAATSAGIKEFVAVGKIRELDTLDGGNFNPKQRRNAGAPPTSEIEAQMGTQAFALYQPLAPKK